MKKGSNSQCLLKAFIVIFFSLSSACCGIFHKHIPSSLAPISWEDEMEGYASWYGKEYHGRKTSSGEVYNMYALTAAHRTLPLGSEVRVQNLENGKKVDVRINDRGPFVENRIIDLSYGSAREIGMLNQGVASVRLTLLKQSAAGMSSGYIIQAGSFLLFENALQLKGELASVKFPVFIESFETNSGKFHRVRIGPIQDKNSALGIISQLRKMNVHPYLLGVD